MASGERIRFGVFQLGALYSRTEIARKGRVKEPTSSRDPNWSSGIVKFDNAILLLVTLDKAASRDFKYEDRFEQDNFWWQSQYRQSQRSPIIRQIEQHATRVMLFVRVTAKRKGHTCKFVYCGRLANPQMEGEYPVTVLFSSVDFVSGASGDLRTIYDWKPAKMPSLAESSRENLLRGSIKRRKGQGFELDPRVRKAIENHAMAAARSHYESLGYTVSDTSSNRPYDYVAKKRKEQRRIEVKGTQGEATSVFVTVGEVSAARQGPEPTDLFVLSGIRVVLRKGALVVAGGNMKLTRGWRPQEKDLSPTQYRYLLPTK